MTKKSEFNYDDLDPDVRAKHLEYVKNNMQEAINFCNADHKKMTEEIFVEFKKLLGDKKLWIDETGKYRME